MQGTLSALGSGVVSLVGWTMPEGMLAMETALQQLELQLYIWLFGGFVSGRLLYAVWLFLVKTPSQSSSWLEEDQHDAAKGCDNAGHEEINSPVPQQAVAHDVPPRLHSSPLSTPLPDSLPHVSCFTQPYMAVTPPKRALSCDLSDTTSPRDKPLMVNSTSTRPHSWPESGLQRAGSRAFNGPIPRPPALSSTSPLASPTLGAGQQLHPCNVWQTSPQQAVCFSAQALRPMGSVEEEPDDGLVVGKDLLTAACTSTGDSYTSARIGDSSHTVYTCHSPSPQSQEYSQGCIGTGQHITVTPSSPERHDDVPPLHLSDSPDRPVQCTDSPTKAGSPSNEVRVSLSGWNKTRVSGGSPTQASGDLLHSAQPQEGGQAAVAAQSTGPQRSDSSEAILIMVDSGLEQASQAPPPQYVAAAQSAASAPEPWVVTGQEALADVLVPASPLSQVQLSPAARPVAQLPRTIDTPLIPRLPFKATPGMGTTVAPVLPSPARLPQSTPRSTLVEPFQQAGINTGGSPMQKDVASPRTPGYLTPATSVALPTTPSLQGSSTRPSAASSPASSVLSTPSTRPLPTGSPRYSTPLPSPRELAATLKFPLPKPVPLLPTTVVPGPAGKALALQRAKESTGVSGSPACTISCSPTIGQQASKQAASCGRLPVAGITQAHMLLVPPQQTPSVRASWDAGTWRPSVAGQQVGFSFNPAPSALPASGDAHASGRQMAPQSMYSAAAGVLHGPQHQPPATQGRQVSNHQQHTPAAAQGQQAASMAVSDPRSQSELQPKQLFNTFAASAAVAQSFVQAETEQPAPPAHTTTGPLSGPAAAAVSSQPSTAVTSQVPAAQVNKRPLATSNTGYGVLSHRKVTPLASPRSSTVAAGSAAHAGDASSPGGTTPGAVYGTLLQAKAASRSEPAGAAGCNEGAQLRVALASAQPVRTGSKVGQASPAGSAVASATQHSAQSPAAAATAQSSNTAATSNRPTAEAAAGSTTVSPVKHARPQVAATNAPASASSQRVESKHTSTSPSSRRTAHVGPTLARLVEVEQVRASSDSWLDEMEAIAGPDSMSPLPSRSLQQLPAPPAASTASDAAQLLNMAQTMQPVAQPISDTMAASGNATVRTQQDLDSSVEILTLADLSATMEGACKGGSKLVIAQDALAVDSKQHMGAAKGRCDGMPDEAASSLGAALQSHILRSPLSEVGTMGSSAPPYYQEISQVVHEFVASAAAAARSSMQVQPDSPRSPRGTGDSAASAQPNPGLGAFSADHTDFDSTSSGMAHKDSAAAGYQAVTLTSVVLAGMPGPDVAQPGSPRSAAGGSLRAGSVACASPARSEQSQNDIAATALRVKAAILEQTGAKVANASATPLLTGLVRMSQSAGGVTSPRSNSGGRAAARRMSEQQYQLRDQRILSNRYVNVMGIVSPAATTSGPVTPQSSTAMPQAQSSTPGRPLGTPIASLLPPALGVLPQASPAAGASLLRPVPLRMSMTTPVPATMPFQPRNNQATPYTGSNLYSQQPSPGSTNLYAEQQAYQWQSAWGGTGFSTSVSTPRQGQQPLSDAHTPTAQHTSADMSPPRHQELGPMSTPSPGNTLSPGTDPAPSAGSTPGQTTGMLHQLPAMADVV